MSVIWVCLPANSHSLPTLSHHPRWAAGDAQWLPSWVCQAEGVLTEVIKGHTAMAHTFYTATSSALATTSLSGHVSKPEFCVKTLNRPKQFLSSRVDCSLQRSLCHLKVMFSFLILCYLFSLVTVFLYSYVCCKFSGIVHALMYEHCQFYICCSKKEAKDIWMRSMAALNLWYRERSWGPFKGEFGGDITQVSPQCSCLGSWLLADWNLPNASLWLALAKFHGLVETGPIVPISIQM